MNASNAQISHVSREAEQRGHEPSMEEILASIRRIIADDEAGAAALREGRRRAEDSDPGRRRQSPPALSVAASSTTEKQAVASVEIVRPTLHSERAQDEWGSGATRGPQEPIARQGGRPKWDHERALAERLEADFYAPVADDPPPAEPAEPLVSAGTAAAVTSQFESLAASVILSDQEELREQARELLRPMMKSWLDDNLPVLVERLVREEIERVARGARR